MTRELIRDLIGQVDVMQYSQFTIDWVERVVYADNWKEDHPDEFVHPMTWAQALAYEVDNILEVMSDDIPDRDFFREVKGWLDVVAA